ncbi:MAG: MarR family transcriptional regulator [Methylococcales bacterium]|nr:MarR family transcriptional regulator [Methylococcales bacterium]
MQTATIFNSIECMAALICAEERKKCAELRLQLVHFELLNYLSHSNRYIDTPSATASYFGMTCGTVSQSLIVLEKKGYIKKNKDEIDKRIIHVNLQPLGRDILKKAQQTALFNAAQLILKQTQKDMSKTIVFTNVLVALQKASLSASFKVIEANKFNHLKNATVFDLVESMTTLIRSKERKRCTELKLQRVHFQIFKYLAHCNKYSDMPATIANYLGVTRGTMSQSLIVLEKKGFISKNQDEKDKRVFHIQLLDKGLAILKKATLIELFEKATFILEKNTSLVDVEILFVNALTALQKANNSFSFGVCNTCVNFQKQSTGFFCQLTQEKLTKIDSKKICQEHRFER